MEKVSENRYQLHPTERIIVQGAVDMFTGKSVLHITYEHTSGILDYSELPVGFADKMIINGIEFVPRPI